MTSKAVSIPSSISVPTSQAWCVPHFLLVREHLSLTSRIRDNDGAGQWSTFIVDVGTPPQTGRVIFSSAGDETWLVVGAGCPSTYPTGCPENRGGQFSPANSTSWVNIDLSTLRLEENLGYIGNFVSPR